MAQTIPSHPDASLLKACVAVAVALRGAEGAYEADATSGKEFAAAIDGGLIERAEKALAAAANCQPTTLDGFRAKADIVDMAFQVMPSGGVRTFLQSLCADITRLHKASADTKGETVR